MNKVKPNIAQIAICIVGIVLLALLISVLARHMQLNRRISRSVFRSKPTPSDPIAANSLEAQEAKSLVNFPKYLRTDIVRFLNPTNNAVALYKAPIAEMAPIDRLQSQNHYSALFIQGGEPVEVNNDMMLQFVPVVNSSNTDDNYMKVTVTRNDGVPIINKFFIDMPNSPAMNLPEDSYTGAVRFGVGYADCEYPNSYMYATPAGFGIITIENPIEVLSV